VGGAQRPAADPARPSRRAARRLDGRLLVSLELRAGVLLAGAPAAALQQPGEERDDRDDDEQQRTDDEQRPEARPAAVPFSGLYVLGVNPQNKPLDNPLLRSELVPEHVKPRLLGHFGTTPGLNLVYAHVNRAIRERDLDTIFVTGPGHGGPACVANAYLEGTYAELYPDISEDLDGLRKLFRQFSFPGGIPSHVAPETPGSIHEGGELGYSLAHAYGAVFDNPGLLACCVVGDGEAETGPLATSWHSNKFLDPETDGVVLPVLHLNGYKIANPTVLARIPEAELVALLGGYGYRPVLVTGGFDGEDPLAVHQRFAGALDEVLDEIAEPV